jgi:hypothetical protein
MASRRTRSRRTAIFGRPDGPERASHEARPAAVQADDDPGGISEITILPDGRVYVLGLSADVLEMLRQSGPWEGLSAARQQRVRTAARTGRQGARQE